MDITGSVAKVFEDIENISLIKILMKYTFGFYRGWGLFIPFAILIFGFGFVSIKLYCKNSSIKALIASTWLSIFAPISWFVLAKEHSYSHFHLNYVVWHIPFTLFGWAMIGEYVCQKKEKIILFISEYLERSSHEC